MVIENLQEKSNLNRAIMKSTFLTALSLLAFTSAFGQQQTIDGALTADDTKRENAYFYDAHTIKVKSPCIIKIWLNSDEFDTYLIVKTPRGQELVNDDDEGSNSYVEVFAEEEGTYTIWASTYNEGSEGAYQLIIDQSDELEIERTEGRLDPRDEQLPKGEYVDTYTRSISVNKNFNIRLKAYGFDGFLVVTSPSGQVWRNDDADDDSSISMISDLSPEAGDWKIQVTTYEEGEVGAYDLEIINEK